MRRLFCLLACLGSLSLLAADPVPRTVLGLYDSRNDPIHLNAELVLNHLGLVVRYHDLPEGLPSDPYCYPNLGQGLAK